MSDVDDFLAHHGVKGMKWGVRREDTGGGGFLSRRKAKKVSKEIEKEAKKATPGTVGVFTKPDGTPVTVVKTKDGMWEETHISEDAARFVRSTMKPQHELSDKDLKQAISRAQMMEQYDNLGIFNKKEPNANKELQDKVDALQLQVKMGEAKAKLKGPSTAARVASFAATMSPAFGVFKQLDNMTGNAVSDQLKSSLSDAFSASKSGPRTTTQAPKAKKQKKAKFKVNSDSVKVTPTFKITDLGDETPSSNNTNVPEFFNALPRGS